MIFFHLFIILGQHFFIILDEKEDWKKKWNKQIEFEIIYYQLMLQNDT